MLFWLRETGQIWGFQAFWSCSVGFPHYDDPLAEIGHIWGFWALSGERLGVTSFPNVFENPILAFFFLWGLENCTIMLFSELKFAKKIPGGGPPAPHLCEAKLCCTLHIYRVGANCGMAHCFMPSCHTKKISVKKKDWKYKSLARTLAPCN